jgi:uncharacterized protein (TIGR02646 family)
MRKVVKSYTNPPGDLGPVTKHNKRLIAIYNGAGKPNTDKIYHYVYGTKKVKNKLAFLYHNKCAYCERKDQEFEIEHYRPKKAVDGEIHDGYFWLCYEWSNLIPACHDCNKKKSKFTKFPIEGTRVKRPVIISGKYKFQDHFFLNRRLKRELPLLIHPEETDFDPRKYFKFDNTGWMIPAAGKLTRKYRRALSTIDDIVRLNRDTLYLNERKRDLRIYEKRFLGMFLKYFENHVNHGNVVARDNLRHEFNSILKEILDKGKPEKEFSFFWTYVFENIYLFLPKRLKKRPKDRTRFHNLISDFKANN